MELSTTGRIAASGTLVSGPTDVTAISLTAGSDAAKLILRDNGVQGVKRWELAAATANSSVSVVFVSPLRFTKDVYAEITGTSPVVYIAVLNPAAAQLQAQSV